jgi:hypothetical protein
MLRNNASMKVKRKHKEITCIDKDEFDTKVKSE